VIYIGGQGAATVADSQKTGNIRMLQNLESFKEELDSLLTLETQTGASCTQLNG
jgi:hypothetical protein